MQCSECHSGFCATRQRAIPLSMRKQCEKGRGEIVDTLLQQIDAKKVQREANRPPRPPRQPRRKTSCRSSRQREYVGAALASRIEGLLGVKSGKGCGCADLATKMNGWGIAGCETNRSEILNALVANRAILVEALKSKGNTLGHAAGIAAEFIPDKMLRSGASWLLNKAIEDVRNQPKPARPQRHHRASRRGRKPYAGWRSEADGPRIEHGPFVSSIRHLTYHVWASNRGDSWQWNLEQLAKRWKLFNGTRIIGVVHDKDSRPADEVLKSAESLGMQFDHQIIKPNMSKLREVVTWVPMLELLKPESSGANEVVFSGHAKGQKYEDPKHTRDWTDLMYQTCLDDWAAVYNALRTSLMAGSFREYGLLGRNSDWAYSGSFFWWRLAEIGRRNWRDVDKWFAGTESWPSKMCDPKETECLFLNDSRRMYDNHYWTETVWPEWEKYQEARSGR